MSSETVIVASNLTKRYRIFDKPIDRVSHALSFGRWRRYQEFTALDNVSFEIYRGEAVGIIGRNGSGKSTLLQLVCGILKPTAGNVRVNGRISALLELGAGFHPEFTGRENAYMNAAVIGLSREEVDAKFEDVVAFADIGDFIDQPVKTYSNGMYVRLAFSVAINVDPDILVVDEALAVGDMFFQAKCMIRLKRMMEDGVTVLFVSHDTAAVKGLCRKCAYLEKGRLVDFGKASAVVDAYISSTHLQMNQALKTQLDYQAIITDVRDNDDKQTQPKISSGTPAGEIFVSTTQEGKFLDGATRYGEGGARILDVTLLNSQRQPTDQIELREEFFIQVSVRIDKDLPTIAIGYSIRDLKGQMLVGTLTSCEKIDVPPVHAGDIYVFEIKSANRLRQGVYTISIGLELPVILNQQHVFLDILENAVVFHSNFPSNPRDWFPAMVLVPAEFCCMKV